MFAAFREQPKSFLTIFMLEVWERFGYYTIQGIIVLYFIRALEMSERDAYYTFGSFFALVYGIVALGGYLGDSILGTKRTTVYGLIVLALGYLAMMLADKQYVFYALGLICVGNGLFKANPASLLAKSYKYNDKRLHAGVTLYYMAINLGAIAALLVGPFLAHHFGYEYVFFASFLGMLGALINYRWQRASLSYIPSPMDDQKISWAIWGAVIGGCVILTWAAAYLLQQVLVAKQLIRIVIAVVVLLYVNHMRKESWANIKKMLLALILMMEAVMFFTLYHQKSTSINLFAVNHVHPYLFGMHVDPQSFQVLNPVWILLLSPILAWIYQCLKKREIVFDIAYKFALGMTCCGLSFAILFLSKFTHDEQGMVSSWWMVGSYFFQALGELLVSAFGVALISELVPRHISGFVMGMWFLTSSAAGFLGAYVASYTALPKDLKYGVDSLSIYTHVFAVIGLATLCVALCMWISAPYLNRLKR